MGVAAGAMVGALNAALHHMLFSNKDKAYKYMIDQSNSGKHEVAGVELEDGRVLVFKEVGNTKSTSNTYYEKGTKNSVNINRKVYRTVNSIHTHPGNISKDSWDKNPLNVSPNDRNHGNMRYDGNIRIIMENQLFPVNVSNPELLTPGNPIWQLK